jgi:putative transposase
MRYAVNMRGIHFMDIEKYMKLLSKMALACDKPEILNSDQGYQFTSERWIACLEKEGIKISMDGIGQWAGNIIIERFWRTIKYEALCFYVLENIAETRLIIKNYINFYNRERFHQSLEYKKPDDVYHGAILAIKRSDFTFESLAFVCNSKIIVQQNKSMGVQMT